MNSLEKVEPLKADFNDLDTLIQENEGPCLSIVLRMSKEAANRKQNTEILRQGVRKAKSVLNRNPAPARVIKSMVEKLDDLVEDFDPVHIEEGIGLFLSPRKKVILHFPFPVNDMILVADSFESRDVSYLKQFLKTYYVLSLAKQSIQLFRGQADKLHEIKDGNFPMHYEETYEYAIPTRAHSYGGTLKGYEKDKGILMDIRVRSLVKEADAHLAGYLVDPHHELILAGVPKLISDFEDHSHTKRNVIRKIPVNYQSDHFQDLENAVWKACQEFRQKEIQSMIKKVDDLPFLYKAIGIRDVWEAAYSGKGHVLLVEKDFRCRAYIPEGSSRIRLRLPKGKFKLIVDVVDDVIEMIIRKNGKVIFVPENSLNKFEGVVLMLRYP